MNCIDWVTFYGHFPVVKISNLIVYCWRGLIIVTDAFKSNECVLNEVYPDFYTIQKNRLIQKLAIADALYYMSTLLLEYEEKLCTRMQT